MHVQFLGAVREVTGSSHLIVVNGKNILLDYGLFQGRREESMRKNRDAMCRPKNIDVVILSHAHMDHCGKLPVLVHEGFKGKIICTHATKDLTVPMLYDSAHIQEQDAFYFKKHKLPMAGGDKPLYVMKDVDATAKLLTGIDYHTKYPVTDDVDVRFYDAGHILGSAIVELTVRENGKESVLVFSGDLGRKGLPIIRDPEMPMKADFLIIESTYGNRAHEEIGMIESELADAIKESLRQGGKILIPSFALERTQEVVYHLSNLINAKDIPEVPVIVDSPLATTLTEIFRQHTECYDEKIKQEFIQNQKNPFGLGIIEYTQSVDDSKKLNEHRGPMIIIAGSGMCENGRIRHHLINNLSDHRCAVLMVGYQAENTLGRKLIDGNKSVKIFGREISVKAKITKIEAFSGHADMHDLDNFITHLPEVKKVFLVHGERDQQDPFAQRLQSKTKAEVIIPEKCGEVHELV